MIVRKTQEQDDLDKISDIYAQSWKVAYRGIVSQKFLNELSDTHWSSVLQTSKWDTFVAVEDGEYIGTSSICPARDQQMNGFGEIVSIYVRPEHWGRGIGQLLLATMVDELKYTGYTGIYLWVLKKNKNARKFYKKNAFIETKDTMTVAIGDKELTELRYVLHI